MVMIHDTSINPNSAGPSTSQNDRLTKPRAESNNQRVDRSIDPENDQDVNGEGCFCDQLHKLKDPVQSRQEPLANRQSESNGISENGADPDAGDGDPPAGLVAKNSAFQISVGLPTTAPDGMPGIIQALNLVETERPGDSRSESLDTQATLESSARPLLAPAMSASIDELFDQALIFPPDFEAVSESSANHQTDSASLPQGFQSDLPSSQQPLWESSFEFQAMDSPGRFNTETGTRTNSVIASAVETARAISRQVTDVVIEEIRTSVNQESKQITLHLHPAELGKLTLHVGWEADSIIARIMASEMATSDMLNQDKNWLIDTLQKNGVELDSFDVSHGGGQNDPPSRQPEAFGRSQKNPQLDAANPDVRSRIVNVTDGAIINLIA